MPQKVENREEKYIPGAWENFVRRRVKKRRIVFMKYATSLAACLVVGWLAFRFVFPSANYPETISRPEERSAISKVPILPHREIASSQTQPKIEKKKGEPTDEMKKLTASSHFPKKQEDTVPGIQKPGSEEEKNFTSPEIQRDIAEKAPQKKTEKKKLSQKNRPHRIESTKFCPKMT